MARRKSPNVPAWDFDVSNIVRGTQQIAANPEELARPVAHAAARVFYEATLRNVQSRVGRVTGNLAGSIYYTFSKDNSTPTKAVYHISWNKKKAPHGFLIEFGHWSYYKVTKLPNGDWITLKRGNAVGAPPSRNADQSVKNAYYVPRETPKWIPAKPFLRPAYYENAATAQQAAAQEFQIQLQQLMK